jgi:hypothetical protein
MVTERKERGDEDFRALSAKDRHFLQWERRSGLPVTSGPKAEKGRTSRHLGQRLVDSLITGLLLPGSNRHPPRTYSYYIDNAHAPLFSIRCNHTLGSKAAAYRRRHKLSLPAASDAW